MNRAKLISTSIRLANSAISKRRLSPQLSNQVTHFSHISHSFSFHAYNFFGFHRRLFSSKPNSVVEIILSEKWSKEIEKELENSNLNPTHELAIYVLKKLDKDPEKAFHFLNWANGKEGFKNSSLTYSLLLRVLASKEFMKQFWVVIKKMKEEGFYIDEETYTTILGVLKREKMKKDAAAFTHFNERMIQENGVNDCVKLAVEVIMGQDSSEEIGNELGELNLRIVDNFVLRTFKELRQHPLKAFEFFRWVARCSGYEHDTVTYNAIARVLGQRDSIKEFWIVAKEMRNQGYEMDMDTYLKISRNFRKSIMRKDAVELYEFMMDGPYEPSEQECVLLLNHLSVDPDIDLVFRVVRKYEAAGHSLSKAMYDGIHRSLTSIGRFEEGEKIIEDMRSSGYEPDNITYSQLVFGLCKADRFDEACRVLDEMEGHGCPPDLKTWTILIQGLCAADQVDKGFSCFAKMMENNLEADGVLLDVLINAFLSQKKLNGAYTLLVEMADKGGVRPLQATYKLLMEKLLEDGQLEKALGLLRMMRKHKHPPFPEPFVKYISKFGTAEDAIEFFEALTIKEHPSDAAYLHLVRSLFNEGRDSVAKDLLFKCPHHIRKHKEIGILFGSAESSKTPT